MLPTVRKGNPLLAMDLSAGPSTMPIETSKWMDSSKINGPDFRPRHSHCHTSNVSATLAAASTKLSSTFAT
jgi:hypothetical protein